MRAFKRVFFVEQDKNPNIDDIYHAVTESLQEKFILLLGDHQDGELSNWPNGEIDTGDQRIHFSEWSSASDEPTKLLQTRIDLDSRSNGHWKITFSIGLPQSGPLIVLEEASWLGEGQDIPFADYPDLIRFLEPFNHVNIDGYVPHIVLPLTKPRVDAFIRFLESSERKLPVLLYSVRPQRTDCQQPDMMHMLDLLYGQAYVVEIQDTGTEWQLSQSLESHRCFSGAVRLYMSQFQRGDSGWDHPFWPCDKDPDEVTQDILNLVVQKSVLLDRDDSIEALESQRNDFFQNEAFMAEREQILRQESELESQSWLDEITSLENRIAKLEERNKNIEKENDGYRDQIRRLEWDLNQRWLSNDEPQSKAKTGPQLYLSAKAQEQYESFDSTEQKYWDQNIFLKLSDSNWRSAKSESIVSINGPCFVALRKNDANGRRVIYYCENGDDICVCEIFPPSQHNKGYKSLRDNGVNRDDYGDFVVWP